VPAATSGDGAFRFGLVHSSSPRPGEWRDRVVEADGLGYDTLLVTDHVDGQYAIGPALAAAAAWSARLTFGSLVHCAGFYRPAVLAREAATLAGLSGGRFELGLGAGWDARDHARAGLPLGSPGERLARLAEAIDDVRARLGDSCPPVLVGGGGPRLLALAAERADIVSFNPRPANDEPVLLFGPANDGAAVEARVRAVREAAGARPVELSVTVYAVAVTTDRDRVARHLARRAGADVEHVLTTPHALIGTPEQIRDTLLDRRDRLGLTYVVVDEWYRHAFAAVVESLRSR
jgi:probable F420-dependent oxidoreductase